MFTFRKVDFVSSNRSKLNGFTIIIIIGGRLLYCIALQVISNQLSGCNKEGGSCSPAVH